MLLDNYFEDSLVFENENALFYSNQNTNLINRDLEQLNEHFKCYKVVAGAEENYVIVDHETGNVKFEGDAGWSSVFNYVSYLKFERSGDE